MCLCCFRCRIRVCSNFVCCFSPSQLQAFHLNFIRLLLWTIQSGGKGDGWHWWCIFKVTGVKCWPNFRVFPLLHFKYCMNSIQIFHDCCFGPNTLGEKTQLTLTFFKSQVSNFDLILGFVQFSTSHIAWIPFEFFSIVALDQTQLTLSFFPGHRGQLPTACNFVWKNFYCKIVNNFFKKFGTRKNCVYNFCLVILQAFHSNFTWLLLGTFQSAETGFPRRS